MENFVIALNVVLPLCLLILIGYIVKRMGMVDAITFKKINKLGKTVIIVTHDMNHVLEYCDDVVVMNKGKVERHVSVTELFRETEYLHSLSIDLPVITSFILKLNEKGFNIDPTIKDINELAKQIGEQLWMEWH